MKTKKIRLALSGDRGRMGKSLKSLIKNSSLFELKARANRDNSPSCWRAYQIDGVVDFSLPELFSKSLAWAVKHKKAFVSGTTGLSAQQKQALKKASQKICVLWRKHEWRGFLFSQWLKTLFYQSPKIQLEDIHHKNKKDKPSGTAIRLKNSLPSFLQKRLKLVSVRKGREFGTHRLTLKTKEEVLVLEHRALNRDLFAKGPYKPCFLF